MEEYINRLAKYEKPQVQNAADLSSANYFYDPQSLLNTHERMICDSETITTFREWIENNRALIQNKVVLEVGCGTGLLSMMAARAGAARVISIEWSSIVDYTADIVKRNGLNHIIKVIKGRVEDVTLPSYIVGVDVIISMWMGASLFQGDRLKAVICARDRWLKPMGHIIPDRATLYICALADLEYKEENIDWWKNVYGFDMSCVTDEALKHGNYSYVSTNNIATNRCKLKEIDLKNHSFEKIMTICKFRLTAKRNDFLQAFMTYFSAKFSADKSLIELNTDPFLPPKFWGQTSFYFKDFIMIKKKESIIGTVNFFHVHNDPRFLGIVIGYYFKGEMTNEIKGMKEFIFRC